MTGRGRPTTYTVEMAEQICLRLTGGEMLIDICAGDDMPGRSTVWQWVQRHPEFADRYRRAREDSSFAMEEEMITAARDARNDWMERHHPDEASWQANAEHIARTRLRVETLRWVMGKRLGRVFGDKTTTEVVGPGGGAVQHELSDLDRAKAVASLIAKVKSNREGEP